LRNETTHILPEALALLRECSNFVAHKNNRLNDFTTT